MKEKENLKHLKNQMRADQDAQKGKNGVSSVLPKNGKHKDEGEKENIKKRERKALDKSL